MGLRRKRGEVPAKPRTQVDQVPVTSPLASPEEAYDVGLIAGLTGGGVVDGFVTNHWRKVVRATREAEHPGPPPSHAIGRGAKAAGHRPGES